MSWYAVEALDDAIEGTREFLFPFDAGTWLRLAIVVFFLGGASSSSPFQGGMQFSSGSNDPVPTPPSPPGGGDVSIPTDTILLVVAAVIIVAVLLGLLFTLIGSMMEFAFVESLRSREVHVRRYMSRYFGQGLRLFVFRLVLFLVVVLPIGVLILVTVPVFSAGSPSIAAGTVLVFIPVFILLALFVALVDGLTTNFVVPVMILQERGVIAGWQAFWPTLRREWKQYGVYLVLKFFLAIAVGFLVSIAGGIIAVFLLIPFAIFAVLLVVAFGGFAAISATLSNPVALVLFGALVLGYVACLLFALALVRVPIQTYLGYFSLLVLGDTNSEFDLIPELREEIR
ncbi:hypothetical protein ZOD2009_09193 [Haladaptatus paucihalophilus DX253]|uniref:Glycerophosphoryl diester phosphodiesterase membrane domain-containing protein n=1 Tax=Haladaptatus paucihalophilus DX253 TaxID=797209 RepID=E7QSR3_HALPU|nr:hypothetical protein [Haladaptatus paucihalophilus]EFW92472.1 hypothetical protein ZOD2009_09193 [Haladaptatus paucihalophilus DX253]SHK07133.1 hypothetical protein SAMN05444342_0476 [Haladaptatus paucihalophilus DX253]